MCKKKGEEEEISTASFSFIIYIQMAETDFKNIIYGIKISLQTLKECF